MPRREPGLLEIVDGLREESRPVGDLFADCVAHASTDLAEECRGIGHVICGVGSATESASSAAWSSYLVVPGQASHSWTSSGLLSDGRRRHRQLGGIVRTACDPMGDDCNAQDLVLWPSQRISLKKRPPAARYLGGILQSREIRYRSPGGEFVAVVIAERSSRRRLRQTYARRSAIRG